MNVAVMPPTTTDAANVVANVATELPFASTESVTCEHCRIPFDVRKGTGGKPQRFCTPACRKAHHAEQQAEQHTGEQSPPRDPVTGLTDAQEGVVQKLMGEARKGREPDFWDPTDGDCNDCTAIRSQPAIAVYWNPRGQVVIRQERRDDTDDDVVVVDPANLRLLIAALEREANSRE